MTILLIRIVGISLFLGCVICTITLGLLGPITGKYFDAQFKKKHKPVPWVFAVVFSRRCQRGAFYALYLLLDPKRLLRLNIWRADIYKERFKQNWGLIDYRKLARKKDWVLAILYHGGLITIFTSVTAGIIIGIVTKN